MPTIYFQYINNQADLLGVLGRHLRREFGIDVVLFCMSKAEVPDGVGHQCRWSDFSEIVELEALFGAQDPPSDDLAGWAERCRDIEGDTGVSLLEAIRGDRHIGLGYNANIWFPSSRFGQSTTYARSVAMTGALAQAVRRRIAVDRPIGLFGMTASFAGLVLWKLAEAAGVRCVSLTMARSGRAMMVTENLAQWPVGFRAQFETALQEANNQAASWMETPHRAQANFAGIAERASVSGLVRQLAQTARTALGKAIRRKPGQYGGYLLHDQFYLTIERWISLRRALAAPSAMESIAAGQPFVFVPLQVDPESSLMVESAPFDNQWAMVDLVSKAVPLGWLVVVKEHPAATAPIRSWFWKALKRRPNVVIAGRFEDSAPLVQRSQAVATINGSLGLQAASIGKPVIAFQPNYVGSIMDHVFVARDLTETREIFQRLLRGDLPALEDRLRNAAAFAVASERVSFPVNHPGLLSGKSTGDPVPDEDLARIVEAVRDVFGLAAATDPQRPGAVSV